MFRIGEEEIAAVARVIRSKQLFRYGAEDSEANLFENEFAQTVGSRHALMTATGTTALTAGLVGLNVGPGDEVIIPGYTFMATAIAVLATGAVPVLAEIDETMTLDPDDVARKISPATKAVIPVHIQGFPCDMERLRKLCDERGIAILEDACQADGGSYRGRRLGTIGKCGAFSFNYYKIISAGEGGALVTDDTAVFERASIWHDGGVAFRPHGKFFSQPIFTGTNVRVTEITAAVMREQLKRMDGILADLRRIKKTVFEAVKDLPGIRTNPSNDPEGDCGVCLPFLFEDEETAVKFEANLPGASRPINTGKHVYSNWTPVLEKRGAFNQAFNPYNNPLNRGLQTDCAPDSLPKTLDLLSRTVYLLLHCDWDDACVAHTIESIRAAAAAL